MRGFFFMLILATCAVGAFLAGTKHEQKERAEARTTAVKPWVVEVLRTTDARGMTYESLHTSTGAPEVQGTVMRWRDPDGRRWIFTEGALAHELEPDKPKVQTQETAGP